ncbi:MAG: AraC family transcriptional regulator [Micrococcales bacterium]|nr:AraC family transcriptional regulator [Micrococcales bacterium]
MKTAPTLVDPAVAQGRDMALAGAVVWRLELLSDAEHLVLPDLSCDVVWDGTSPVAVPRTTSRLVMPAHRGEVAAGLRLPAGATRVTVDPTWPGWHLDDPRDLAERVDRLVRAVEARAVRWQVDTGRDRLLSLLDQPGVRLRDVTAATGWSESTVRRVCHEWFGVSPGTVAQVLRLWRFAQAVASTSLSDAAYDAGFADQQHASRGVRALAGLQPSELATWASAAR